MSKEYPPNGKLIIHNETSHSNAVALVLLSYMGQEVGWDGSGRLMTWCIFFHPTYEQQFVVSYHQTPSGTETLKIREATPEDTEQ